MNAEDQKYADFWEKLGRYIEEHNLTPMFDEANRTIEKYEYIYNALRQQLDPEKEDDLVLYVASCEEYCRRFAFAAYEMGREEGPLG